MYFSGAGGVGIGPLMEIAADAGFSVTGSDAHASLMTERLAKKGLIVTIGQDGTFLKQVHEQAPVEWFVHSAALPADHPELVFAHKAGIKTSKRDEFLSELIEQKKLQLIAVSGTHGKTTTTGMLIWVFKQLGIPLSYSVGTTLSFAQSGHYTPDSEFFVYECDEYDRNMLHFHPYLSIVTSLDYDHPDTYPTLREYQDAFIEFLEQSDYSLLWTKDLRALGTPDIQASLEAYDEHMDLSYFHLSGIHVRQNAFLVERALHRLFPDISKHDIIAAINSFPGTGRRFEKLADNLYSDYGHHPAEIAATLQLAKELSESVVLVYQPHQNVRQHEIRHQYTDCMIGADTIYWLPTYLSREDPTLEILTPEQLSEDLDNATSVIVCDLNDELWSNIETARAEGKLVLVMGAGSIDEWVREKLSHNK